MKVGDYARSSEGDLGKIVRINNSHDIELEDSWVSYDEEDLKSSPNIIDLLKKKDIVTDYKGNIYQVDKVFKDYVFTDKKNEYGQIITLVDYQIKSIVTKEQFSSMEYKVGD